MIRFDGATMAEARAEIAATAPDAPGRLWLCTGDLQAGDLVHEHGCTFRLVGAPDVLCLHRGPVYSWATELVAHSEPGPMPRAWAETWTVQGSDRAWWSVTRPD